MSSIVVLRKIGAFIHVLIMMLLLLVICVIIR